jgi:hypothetical protein
MAWLTAHLREPGDHGRLGFHADCPVCREERLFGVLSTESVVSRRAQAALATGALAVSFAAPSGVFAQEPDIRQEGNVAPQEPSDGRHGHGPSESETPGFDPGGDTVLPVEVEAPSAAPHADDGSEAGGPLEAEPEIDPDVRLVAPTESETETPAPDNETPVTPAPPPAPAAPEASPPATAAPKERAAPRSHPGAGRPTEKRRGRTGAPGEGGESGGPRAYPAVPHAAEPVTETPATVQLAPAGQRDVDTAADAPPLRRGARFHVVRPGESLWAIARRLVGPDASMARIAREVHRLWELNEDRIATGDPDLLMVGTKLRLR